MPSALHNASFFHDDNLMRRNNGRKAMGNHNDRLVLYQRLQSHLHFMLVFRVSESSRFVQHQYRSILQYGTSHTYPLGFTAGQEYTFIAYPCFVALRQTLYEIVALGQLSQRLSPFLSWHQESLRRCSHKECRKKGKCLERRMKPYPSVLR